VSGFITNQRPGTVSAVQGDNLSDVMKKGAKP